MCALAGKCGATAFWATSDKTQLNTPTVIMHKTASKLQTSLEFLSFATNCRMRKYSTVFGKKILYKIFSVRTLHFVVETDVKIADLI